MKKQEKEKGFVRQSIENFWYYYKWPFLGGIVIFFAVLIGLTAATDMKEPADADILAVFARPLTMQELEFQSKLEHVAKDTDGNGKVVIGTEGLYISESGTGDNDSVSMNKFESKIAYAEADLVLMDKTNMERFSPKDFLEPLESYMDISKFSEEDLFYRDGVAVGVRLSDSKVLMEKQFIIDSVYAGIMFVPEDADDSVKLRRDNAVKMIEELVKQ